MLNERFCYSAQRSAYVEKHVRPYTRNPLVIAAFQKVPRHEFVPPEAKTEAYDDNVINVRDGFSISQPSLVALMVDYLNLTGKEKVLEVGAGSGFVAAILSECVAEVHAVDIDQVLVDGAVEKLSKLGCENVTIHQGDGALGWAKNAPYDSIIVSAGTLEIPQALVDQLKEGGRIVIPFGEDLENLRLVVGVKSDEVLLTTLLAGEVSFYPLMSPAQGGWTKEALQEVNLSKRQKQASFSVFCLEWARKSGFRSTDEMIDKLAAELGEPVKKVVNNLRILHEISLRGD